MDYVINNLINVYTLLGSINPPVPQLKLEISIYSFLTPTCAFNLAFLILRASLVEKLMDVSF